MSTPPFKVKAIYDYSSPHDDDLHFPSGQIITVTEVEDEEWFVGEYIDASGDKQDGIFPRNFVEKFEPTAPPRPARAPRSKKETEPTTPAAVAEVHDPLSEKESIHDTTAAEVDQPRSEIPPSVLQPLQTGLKTEGTTSNHALAPAPAPVPAATKPPPKAAPAKAAPPQVSEKPSGGSFRDRIAAFNKPAAPPVAPFKPGGLGSGGSSFIKKPFIAPPPSKNAYVPAPREPPPQRIYKREEDPEIAARQSEDLVNAEKAGLAPSSPSEGNDDQPKPTSLKERIALLQKQQMEQASRHADAAHKKEKPKRPAKKRVDSHGTAEVPPEGDDAPLEKLRSNESGRKQSTESTREDLAPPPRRQSTMDVTPLAIAHGQEIGGIGNDADASQRLESTNEPGILSSGNDEIQTKRRSMAPQPPARAPTAPMQEADVGEEEGAVEEEVELKEDDEEEDEEEDEEDEIDEETRRKEEIRARMAKMSGGMGMHGMFGPPGGMPMPTAPPKKQKASASSGKQRSDYDTETVSSPGSHAPPVPIMVLPGMGRTRSPEETDNQLEVEQENESAPQPISSRPADEIADIEDIEPSLSRGSHDRALRTEGTTT